jgi:hypothetical protein
VRTSSAMMSRRKLEGTACVSGFASVMAGIHYPTGGLRSKRAARDPRHPWRRVANAQKNLCVKLEIVSQKSGQPRRNRGRFKVSQVWIFRAGNPRNPEYPRTKTAGWGSWSPTLSPSARKDGAPILLWADVGRPPASCLRRSGSDVIRKQGVHGITDAVAQIMADCAHAVQPGD